MANDALNPTHGGEAPSAGRRLSRRGSSIALAALLVASVGGYAAADELGLVAASAEASPTASDSAGPSASHSAGASTTPGSEPSAGDATASDSVTYNENMSGGGGRNIVSVTNRVDGDLAVRGAIQLNRIKSPTVEPWNFARAYSSCTECRTLAVAMQLNLIQRGSPRVTPQNAAVALNVECMRCITIAIALQYTFSVDDPNDTPPEVRALIREMDRELRSIAADRTIDLYQAVARVDAVIARFRTLAESLDDRRDEATEPTSPDAQTAPTEPPPDPSPSAEPASSSPPPSATPDTSPAPSSAEATAPPSATPSSSPEADATAAPASP